MNLLLLLGEIATGSSRAWLWRRVNSQSGMPNGQVIAATARHFEVTGETIARQFAALGIDDPEVSALVADVRAFAP